MICWCGSQKPARPWRPNKCELTYDTVSYQGLDVNKNAIYLTPDRIEATKYFPWPTAVKQPRRFLRMAFWCSRFIEDYESISAPLNDLLKGWKKPSDDKWASEGFLGSVTCYATRIGTIKIFEVWKLRLGGSGQSMDAKTKPEWHQCRFVLDWWPRSPSRHRLQKQESTPCDESISTRENGCLGGSLGWVSIVYGATISVVRFYHREDGVRSPWIADQKDIFAMTQAHVVCSELFFSVRNQRCVYRIVKAAAFKIYN